MWIAVIDVLLLNLERYLVKYRPVLEKTKDKYKKAALKTTITIISREHRNCRLKCKRLLKQDISEVEWDWYELVQQLRNVNEYLLRITKPNPRFS